MHLNKNTNSEFHPQARNKLSWGKVGEIYDVFSCFFLYKNKSRIKVIRTIFQTMMNLIKSPKKAFNKFNTYFPISIDVKCKSLPD